MKRKENLHAQNNNVNRNLDEKKKIPGMQSINQYEYADVYNKHNIHSTDETIINQI